MNACRACSACLRRSWLLDALAKQLRYRGRDHERLLELLALDDHELIAATGGKETESLHARHASFEPASLPDLPGVERICRHDPGYPAAVSQTPGGPWMLNVAGGSARLHELLAEPAVAIVGTRTPSDYGLEIAHGLARGLAAAGVTILGALAEGIPAAALAGALEAGGPTLTVMPGGVDVCYPATRRPLFRRLGEAGCILSELPCGSRPGGWAHAARLRTVVALATLVIVVEASERPIELLVGSLARASGCPIGAVPGRVTSPGACGPNALLADGAHLIRDPQDALDAFYGLDARRAPPQPPDLEPRLRSVLHRVAAGRDTVAKLTPRGAHRDDTLIALAELELAGALTRGDGGRYVACL